MTHFDRPTSLDHKRKLDWLVIFCPYGSSAFKKGIFQIWVDFCLAFITESWHSEHCVIKKIDKISHSELPPLGRGPEGPPQDNINSGV